VSHTDVTTALKQAAFLDALAEYGTITKAAEVAGIDRKTHYNWLGPKEQPNEEYATRYAEASEQFADHLRLEARRRAVEGVTQLVYHSGVVVGSRREYSDRLLELLLKAKCPEFKDKTEITHKGNAGFGILRVEFVDSPSSTDPEAV
jgi:hypothetical protein